MLTHIANYPLQQLKLFTLQATTSYNTNFSVILQTQGITKLVFVFQSDTKWNLIFFGLSWTLWQGVFLLGQWLLLFLPNCSCLLPAWWLPAEPGRSSHCPGSQGVRFSH